MLAREGRLIFFVIGIAITVLHALFHYWAVFSWPLLLFVYWIYRDPERNIPSAPLGIVSPADGVIIGIEKKHDPFIDREALSITIKMTWRSVFVLRGATEGNIVKHWLHAHKIDQDDKKLHIIWIQTDEKDDIVVSLQAGSRWAKMHCHVGAGDRVGQGKRCGFIPFGTQVEVFVPKNSKLLVAEGDSVIAGRDVLAELIH